MSIESELARLARYDELLSSVMPADFKDWFQNSKEEWPLVAKLVIEDLRESRDDAQDECDRMHERFNDLG